MLYRLKILFTHTLLLATVSGVLIGSAAAFAPLWWCVIPGVALLYACVVRTSSYATSVWYSLLIGFLKAGIAVSWLLAAYPADWLGGAGRFEQFVVIFGCWLGSTLSVGVGYALIGVFVYATRRYAITLRAVSFAGALLSSELLGSLGFSIYTYGNGGVLNVHFANSYVGFALAYHSLLKHVAVLWGVYGLTILVALISFTLYELAWRPHTNLRRVEVVVLFLLCLYLTGVVPDIRTLERGERVAAVGTAFDSFVSFSDSELAREQRILGEGIEEALQAGATTVVLPEDARFGDLKDERTLYRQLAVLPHTPGAVVVDSSRTEVSATTAVMRAFIYDIDAKKTYRVDKQFIVPMGEYLPYLHTEAVRALGGEAFFANMTHVSGTAALDARTPAAIPNVLFCFEGGATALAREKVAAHTSALMAHPVSHGWFHRPYTLWNEERQMLIVQALYTGTAILQAGNNAPTELYRADGSTSVGTIIAADESSVVVLFSI